MRACALRVSRLAETESVEQTDGPEMQTDCHDVYFVLRALKGPEVSEVDQMWFHGRIRQVVHRCGEVS